MNDKLTLNDYISYRNESAQSDDVYDFSNNSTEDHMIQRRYIEEPNYNYTDEDEEEDINFDYEYGYDYERVIKDRLKKVNQDFVNDAEPSNRKTILVSFDNAVTAIDISIEEQQKLQAESFVSGEERSKFRAALDQVQLAEDNVVKVPLNDIIQKKDPDAFANQVRIKNSMYDAQVQQQQVEFEAQQRQTNEVYELNEHDVALANSSALASPKKQTKSVKLSSVNIVEKSKPSRTSSSPTVLSPSPLSPSAEAAPRAHTASHPVTRRANKKARRLRVAEVAVTEAEAPAPQLSLRPQQGAEYESWSENDQEQERQRSRVEEHNNRLISFSANSRDNIQSPSPIFSSKQTDQSSNNEKQTTKGKSDNFFDNMSPAKENDESLVINSNRTVDSSDSNNERILVEKDGVFKLMTTEEHTAYEEQRKKETATNLTSKDTNSLNSTLSTSSTITSQKQSSSAAVKVIPPVSVQRRVTTNSAAVRPKSSIIPRDIGSTLVTRLDMNERETSQSKKLMNSITNLDLHKTHARLSHSADPKNRTQQTNKNSNWRTPDYASDYKSPYQMKEKIVKIAETAEERRKREQEKEDRKRINELAFKAWLKQKEEQKLLETKMQKNPKSNEESNQSTANGTITTTINSDDRVTFDAWLLKKQKQLENEKEFKKSANKYTINESARMKTPEERSKAFKEWLNRKTKEKLDVMMQEKLDLKKWTSKRRRSRKHQRLSQALELAHAYGYNSPYRSPGGAFNF